MPPASKAAPERFPAGIVPTKFVALADSAKLAYGVGVNCWRGDSVPNEFAPLVLTAICSQLFAPVKTSPKSTGVVNNPLVTLTAEFVTGPAMATPPLLAEKSENEMSYLPLAKFVPLCSRP